MDAHRMRARPGQWTSISSIFALICAVTLASDEPSLMKLIPGPVIRQHFFVTCLDAFRRHAGREPWIGMEFPVDGQARSLASNILGARLRPDLVCGTCTRLGPALAMSLPRR